MKNLFCSIIMSILFFTASAQLSNEQFSIITKVSADWCPNCGNWAWDAFEDMRSDLADKNAIYVLAHRDGNLMNDVSLAWCQNLKYQYQPEFYLNNDFQNMNGNSAPTVIESIGEQIDVLSSFGAFAGIQGEAVITEGNTDITAHVDVEFFNDTPGEYYLGVYFIQNNIMANQSGQGTVMQPKLLTGGFTEDWFGVPVAGTTGLQSIDITTSQPADFSSEEGDTEILSVLWNKIDEETYVIFNAHVNGTIQQLSSTNELSLIQETIKGNIVGTKASITFESTQNVSKGTFFVNNIVGKTVYTQSVSNIAQGRNSIGFNVPNLTNGIYLLGLNIDGKTTTVKVVKK